MRDQQVAAELQARQEAAFAHAIRAIVRTVNDERGYIVAYPENQELTKNKSITLSKVLWLGTTMPQPSQVIELAQVEEFGGGWRAQLGRPIELKT